LNKQYGTILVDPPWPEYGGGKIKRGADRHYPLMHVDDIAAMPVESLALPDSHLFLWVTNNFLPSGLEVMRAWGFRYVTCITWAKDKAGLGQYFRGMTEQCLFGTRGKPGYRMSADGKRRQGRTLITAPRGLHSAKPEQLRSMIEVVSPGPYVELFARASYPNWDRWGNGCDSNVDFGIYRQLALV
jgi:N6-adenosine-specific RNA methylase IME4